MKLLMSLLLSLSLGTLYGQDTGILSYANRSTLLLNKLNAGTISPEEKKELQKTALVIQNYGQQMDEAEHNYQRSLLYINKAIVLFHHLGDTLSEANNRKFKGYLLGMLGDRSEAKKEVRIAIELYQLKSYAPGVAVSQFDLSRVFEREGELDSAIFQCKTSLAFWKSAGNIPRMFNVQNMLIHLLDKASRNAEATLVQEASDSMAADKKIHVQDLRDFYLVSRELFQSLGNKEKTDHYQYLYQRTITGLRNEGMNLKSYYDEPQKQSLSYPTKEPQLSKQYS